MRQISFTVTSADYDAANDLLIANVEHKSDYKDVAFKIALDFNNDHHQIFNTHPTKLITLNAFEVTNVLAAFANRLWIAYAALDHDASPLDAALAFDEFAVNIA